MRSALPLLLCVVLCAGCSAAGSASSAASRSPPELTWARSVGQGPRFRPGPTGPLVARASPVDGMRCRVVAPILAAAHVEVFSSGHVVVIPAGIGVAPPFHRRGAYVDAGRCVYPLLTVEPTGLLLMRSTRVLTLGQLFELWGEPLSEREVAGFLGPASSGVSVFIDGARWRGSPSSAPIDPAAQITIEVGPYVTPHSHYTFPALQSLLVARGLR